MYSICRWVEVLRRDLSCRVGVTIVWRAVWATSVATWMLGSPPPTIAQVQVGAGNLVVRLQEFASGLGGAVHISPTDVVPLGDGSGRMAVSTINGVVRLLDNSGSFLDTVAAPYLDARSEPDRFIPGNFPFGMTGIAFHPDFADPSAAGYGRLYTIITERHQDAGNPNLPDLFDGLPTSGGAHQDVLVEWSTTDPVADNPAWTRRTVLRMEQPHENHNVTDLAFGPDGLLYLASGDGGNPGRFTAPQDVTTYIGKMLRIDPLSPVATGTRSTGGSFINSGNGQYRIPTTNPGVGIPIEVEEVYAYGLRSPYRFNFDRQTGALLLGDVGEGTREEVSIIQLDGNYGWGRFEGTFERDPSIVLADGTTHTPPIFEYGRSDGETVVGGFIYRGAAIPELQGKYVFADFGRQVAAGQVPTPARLFYGDMQTGEIFEFNIDRLGEPLVEVNGAQVVSRQFLLSIGEDDSGELYLVVGDDPQFPRALEPDGRILRILAGSDLVFGDLNDDEMVDMLDWQNVLEGLNADLSGLTLEESYRLGDLNGDHRTNYDDIKLFRTAWFDANGASFAVPEPTLGLMAWATLYVLAGKGRRLVYSNVEGDIRHDTNRSCVFDGPEE
ncbi:MAG: PQQ-dependent sugar dehydrogenase [Pirellulaceae bacterium]|nr:PQQ-dependent sugar dehydrogenase [Planctomycetales bacterium]